MDQDLHKPGPLAHLSGTNAPLDEHWQLGKAVVRDVRGKAEYRQNDQHWHRLRTGKVLREGAEIRVGKSSAVDFFLGPGQPLLWLKSSSRLGFKRLRWSGDSMNLIIQTEIDLPEGSLRGRTADWATNSDFQISGPGFICAPGQWTWFRVIAADEIRLVEGSASVWTKTFTNQVESGTAFTIANRAYQKLPLARLAQRVRETEPLPSFMLDPAGNPQWINSPFMQGLALARLEFGGQFGNLATLMERPGPDFWICGFGDEDLDPDPD